MPERTVSCNGVDLHVVEEGSGPPVIFSHGFPELAYSWRHQLPALARAGYRAIAPDQRGYGRSSRPVNIADYDIEHLSGDLIALLDELGEDEAVFVGHDWGSMVVWQTALLHPERVAGVCGMSVPFTPRPPVPPTQAFRSRYGENFFYILYFQEPGVADAELNARPGETMRRMLAGTRVEPDRPGGMDVADDGRGFVDRFPEMTELPAWLSQDELDFYIGEFTRTGFTGGLNWYRNFDRNWERTPQLAGAKVEVPSFFIAGTADPVIVMTPPSVQDSWRSDNRGDVFVEGAGHWVQQEAPEEVNAALLGFLDSIGHGEKA
ncbi:alpha/beta fold hydrolase [Saccharopolyspora flava]|uniref:Pimeloyl-ACP methyl ester carboxylesterase n=1 Tax=Saccharopolyspora flava TaxID=95161 RepID=A0A1I6SCQ9_9PSEU|nr:alpha/beta hydrolase [Saccharopolyspora flava]SFS74742.1 Pimeloyl-ACP methyl ester carboxylesterase [Saccharopolyspora flava]